MGGQEKQDNQRQNLIVTVDFTNPVSTQACTHQYAVTKASQIGNSFSQFRFNDHRGNVNVTDAAGASLYSPPASIFVLHHEDQEGRLGGGGQETEMTCCLTE